jgi:hypothetical protein
MAYACTFSLKIEFKIDQNQPQSTEISTNSAILYEIIEEGIATFLVEQLDI